MELNSRKNIQNLLKKYHALPSKGLGQNFLIDKAVLNKFITAADIKSDDVVLEIGPGLGTLTQGLAKKAKKVIAVEKSAQMAEILKETLSDYKNVDIVISDVLKIENFKLISNLKFQISNYKVVANLPFYITAPVIRKFLEAENPPTDMILIVQKEVAQRICEKPPRMNLLAVSVQFYSQPKIISYISRKSFFPEPKVDCAILKITPFGGRRVSPELFFKIVKAGFSHPRKQIAGNLLAALSERSEPNGQANKDKIKTWLSKNNIQPTQRAETLAISDWEKLAQTFNF